MSGQKGQNGPHYLKCSKCKKRRDDRGYARTGDLVRTGRTKGTRIPGRGRGTMDTPYLKAHELVCLVCDHRGWYTHRDAATKPLDTR